LRTVKPFTPEVRANIDYELVDRSIDFMRRQKARNGGHRNLGQRENLVSFIGALCLRRPIGQWRQNLRTNRPRRDQRSHQPSSPIVMQQCDAMRAESWYPGDPLPSK
jgi:hypothetical protein